MSRLREKRIYCAIGFYFLASWILAVGFFDNRWQVPAQGWFFQHQRDTEAHVIGRMVLSRQQGIFSMAGMNGVGLPSAPADTGRPWPNNEIREMQYEAYNKEMTFPYYSPYLSQPGSQGWFFSWCDQWLTGEPTEKLETFRWWTSGATALVLSGILLWIYFSIGALPACLALASLVLSPWLTVFGKNLWWSMWSFFLPMLTMIVSLKVFENKARDTIWLMLALTMALWIKDWCQSFSTIFRHRIDIEPQRPRTTRSHERHSFSAIYRTSWATPSTQ